MKNSQDSVVEAVHAAILRDGLLEPGQRVIVAASGGADSTALLHVLAELGYRVEAAYFDHRTRGGESARDALFVRDTAAALGIPFHTDGADVDGDARSAGRSFEDQARHARYAFLRRVAGETGCGVAAVAHHLDDQAETVLLHLLRGTAGRGLAGMAPFRTEDGMRIVRPLLGCTRAELRAWLRGRGISWREDATNADPHHALRNRVRHELLPALSRGYNPAISRGLARLAHAQRLDNELLDRLLEQECVRLNIGPVTPEQIPVSVLLSMHPALRRRWWLKEIERIGARPHWAHIDAADTFFAQAGVGERLDMGGGVLLYKGRDSVTFTTSRTDTARTDAALAVPGETTVLGRVFSVSLRPASDLPPGGARARCAPSRQVFDAARVCGALRVRTRQPGDRFRPLGMHGSRKLQDYFVDRGVPEPLRNAVPLVVADDGILWIVGHAPSADAAVTPETEQLLEVEVRDARE